MQDRPPHQRSPRQRDTREAILAAAMAVFAEQGFQGAAMAEVARRAGVAKGTPYLHFSDKADLFYAVYERWAAEAATAALQAIATPAPAPERILALAMSAVDYMETHREWFPLTMEIWAASGTPGLRARFAQALTDIYASYRKILAAVIREGQAAGEIRAEVNADALAALLTGAVDGLYLQNWFDPTLDVRALIEDFFAALSHGIVPPTTPPITGEQP